MLSQKSPGPRLLPSLRLQTKGTGASVGGTGPLMGDGPTPSRIRMGFSLAWTVTEREPVDIVLACRALCLPSVELATSCTRVTTGAAAADSTPPP
eukprot:COSAG01_NODE_41720_length_448_cov_0.724928_1_plen_94_part_01